MQHLSHTSVDAPRTHRGLPSLLVAALAAISLAVALVPATPAAAQEDGGSSLAELQKKRDAVRAQKAAKASEVNGLKATDAQVSAALSALDAQVNAQQDRVEEAQRAVSQAESERSAAESAQARTQQELDDLRARMKTSAVEAYVTMGSSDPMSGVGVDDVNDAVNKRTLLSVQANENTDVVEQFRSKQEDLELQRAAATAAAERAARSKAAVQDRLGDLNAAFEKQQAFAAQVDSRLDRALSEADSLGTSPSTPTCRRPSRPSRLRSPGRWPPSAAAEARARARRTSPRSPAVGAAEEAVVAAFPATTGSGEIVSVGGIRPPVDRRQPAGAAQRGPAAGINLSGGRGDPAGRSQQCAATTAAPATTPSTRHRRRRGSANARPRLYMQRRPGHRLHPGRVHPLRAGSSGFAWPMPAAWFRNLLEPWHWSTNGNRVRRRRPRSPLTS